ncbi:MAG: phosphoribosyltransferase [Acidimicrobiales bacterium]
MTAAPVLSGAEVQQLVDRLAADIARDHPDGVVLVGVLKASVLLVADLCRSLSRQADTDVRVDFIETSSFRADSGRVRLVQDLREDIGDRPVVLVTTLVDTGLRLGYLRTQLANRAPASLRIAALFDKAERRILPIDLDYVGTTIPNRFVVGYGLDAAGQGRHLSGVVALDDDHPVDPATLSTWLGETRDALLRGSAER